MMDESQHRRRKQTSDDVLDAQAAAWFLGAHVETVRRLARKGGLPAYKMGKDWRFNKSALQKWVEAHHLRERVPLVLVVDDEKSIRETTQMFLEGANYLVKTAASGEEALEQVRHEMPDLVLLDLVMPGIGGVEVLEALHKKNPDLAVVVITAYPDSDLMARALRFPPVMLLPKPLKKETLLKTVARILKGVQ